jgi:preprotein translocase subunit SecD
MNSLRNLLQDADPLRHEAPHLDAGRARIRQTVLHATPIDGTTASRRRRLSVASTLAVAVIGVAAIGYVLWTFGSTRVQAAVRFEARLAEDQPIAGLVVAQIADSGRLIYLHPEIVVSNDDIARSWVVDDGSGRFTVAVELLPSGAERMRQATRGHIGRPMALLVDGRVVAAPVVRSAIGDAAEINGLFTRAEADRIADGISRP